MKTRGVSLIETLVALVVVSYGALGAVALQLELRHAHAEAAQRALAARLAWDLAQRLRASSASALPMYLTGSTPLGRASLGTEPPPDCRAGAPCSEGQFAALERWRFEQALDGTSERISGAPVGGLVSPSACVTGPSAGGDGTYTVTLAWRGAIALPDDAATSCGRDPQAGGEAIYSRQGNDNVLRRTLSLPIAITASRGAP